MERGRKKQLVKNGKKKCSRCKQWLFLKKFSKDRKLSSEYRSHCKECQCKYAITPKGIYWRLTARSRKKRIELPQKDFLEWYEKQEKICVYCGTKENTAFRCWKSGRFQIDRKDNNKSYQLENMALACSICNFIKGNYFTYEEMLKIGEVIKEIRKSQRP